MNVYLALLVQILVSGGTHIVAKAVVGKVDPAIILFLRTIISVSAMTTIFFLRGKRLRIDRGDWGLFLLVGFLGVPINQYLYLYGMKFTTAANGALLYAATPSFVLLLSHFFLREKITGLKTCGIALAFIGISIVIFEKGVSFSSEYTFGNLMILIAVIAWAFFTILGKKLIVTYGALSTTTGMMICGTGLFLPFGIYFSAAFPFSELNAGDWMGIVYLSLGTSVLGYLLWYYALSRIDTAKVAVFSNGQPIVATILAMIFLDYTITGEFVVGCLMTIAGVSLSQLG
ncbi:MAG: DMT family transporter [Ignavibacteriales bacterium]|nr:DMT family transporter [Ignavibacteriales bacterium]